MSYYTVYVNIESEYKNGYYWYDSDIQADTAKGAIKKVIDINQEYLEISDKIEFFVGRNLDNQKGGKIYEITGPYVINHKVYEVVEK